MGVAVFVIQLAAFLVASGGMSANWAILSPLAAALAIEASACFPLFAALPFQALIAAIGLRGLRGGDAWAVTLPPAPIADRLGFLFFLALLSGLTLACRSACARIDGREGEVERLDRSIAQLVDANMGFQRYAIAAGATSAESERKRISRDIHDTAVHSLVNIIMLAEAATDRIGGDERLLARIISVAKDAVSDTRVSLRELRDMEELAAPGLGAVDRLARVFSEATGVRVSVNYGNMSADPGAEAGEAIYRLVQEGLTNAFRHGAATSVDVSFWIEAAEGGPVLGIRVRDDGRGAAAIEKGIGLSGMEERLRAVGGGIEAGGLADGFEVRAWLPLPEEGR